MTHSMQSADSRVRPLAALATNEVNSTPDLLKTPLLLAAIAIGGLEVFIPRLPLFPWLKPGLANTVTLVWLIRYGPLDTILFSFLRVWLVGFFFGFSFLTFTLSMSGAICSLAAMGVLWELLGRQKRMGTIGVAVAGAVCHNAGQLVAVFFLFSANVRLLYQIPIMAGGSIFFGALVGALAPGLLSCAEQTAQRRMTAESVRLSQSAQAVTPAAWQTTLSLGLLAACVALVFIEKLALLAIIAGAVTLLVQIAHRVSLRAFWYPITRFWLLFLCVGAMHAFLSYGIKIPGMPWMTFEGVSLAFAQWLRLWAWIQTTFLFSRLGLHASLFAALRRLFPRNTTTLAAGLVAAEHFPAVFDRMQRQAPAIARLLVRKPQEALRGLYRDIIEQTAREGDITT